MVGGSEGVKAPLAACKIPQNFLFCLVSLVLCE